VLPAFIAWVAAWAAHLQWAGSDGTGTVDALLPLLAIGLCALLWLCTAMIYACIRFIQEWAHPLTLANYVLIGLSSGLVLACALAALAGEAALLAATGPLAVGFTALAAVVRGVSMRRNAALKPRSTLQSATGIAAPKLVQRSMGMSAGAFNTREFFHGVAAVALRRVKAAAIFFGFVLPLVALGWALAGGGTPAWVLALVLQWPGLIAERWFFFAQARHPQNLYYQVVS
jgi:DMSO reductase anchor subunit